MRQRRGKARKETPARARTASFGHRRLKDRQEAFLRSVIPRAQEAGLTHLLHIDTDELIYCHEGVGALHAFLAQHATSADIHMLNMEALVSEQAVRAAGYSRDFDPFRECFAFWHHRPSFSAYSNGKSFCSLQAGRLLRPMGPHHFTAEPRTAVDVPPRVAVVLHYECCSFELWREKYTELVRSHDAESIERIPFEFYRESMRFAARLLKASGGGDVRALANAENDARQFWFSWKRMPLDAQRRASEVCQGASGLPRHLGTGKRPCCVLSNGVTLLWVFKGQAHDHKAEAMYTVLGAVKEDRVEERLMLDASVPHEQAMVYASRLRVLTSKLNSSGCRYGSKELVDAAVQAGMPLGFRIRLRHALDAATCTGDLESSP